MYVITEFESVPLLDVCAYVCLYVSTSVDLYQHSKTYVSAVSAECLKVTMCLLAHLCMYVIVRLKYIFCEYRAAKMREWLWLDPYA